jgi:putative SOS response-associated peptidase YedK
LLESPNAVTGRMCNEHRRTVELGRISDAFAQLRIPLRFPEGAPNLAALESIRITDPSAIVRARAGEFELVQRRWSWPGPTAKPVFNYRSEGREFGNQAGGGRCLIVADGFYEYTAPEGGGRRKTRWLFTKRGEDFFCIAGIWRSDAKVGEACTMLTAEPGADVAPYHDRQVVVIERGDWKRWLDGSAPARDLLAPSPTGTFEVARA